MVIDHNNNKIILNPREYKIIYGDTELWQINIIFKVLDKLNNRGDLNGF
jgi:hypothetical protein